MRIKWEKPPNPDCRTVHIDAPLFKCFRLSGLEELDQRQRGLVESIGMVLGVQEFSVWPYRIQIIKGKVFNWDEITFKIEDILRDWLFEDCIERQEPYDWSNK